VRAIAYPFRVGGDGMVASARTQPAVWGSRLRLLLSTGAGERAHRPDYGVDFTDALFDDVDEASETVSNEVSRAVNAWLPEVELVEVAPSVEDSSVLVRVSYRTPNGATGTSEHLFGIAPGADF